MYDRNTISGNLFDTSVGRARHKIVNQLEFPFHDPMPPDLWPPLPEKTFNLERLLGELLCFHEEDIP